MQKYYTVFDATPSFDYSEPYLRVGIGLEEHMKEYSAEERQSKASFLDKYIAIFYTIGILVIFIIISCIVLTIRNKRQRDKLEQMDKASLEQGAEKLMRQFKDGMDRKNQMAREKAIKKWQKKFPGRSLEEFGYADMSEASGFDSSFNPDLSSSATSHVFTHTN